MLPLPDQIELVTNIMDEYGFASEADISEGKDFAQLLESAYREAAGVLGLKSSTLQAITWLSYRRRTGLEDHWGR